MKRFEHESSEMAPVRVAALGFNAGNCGQDGCFPGGVPQWAGSHIPVMTISQVYALAYGAARMTVQRTRPGRWIKPSAN